MSLTVTILIDTPLSTQRMLEEIKHAVVTDGRYDIGTVQRITVHRNTGTAKQDTGRVRWEKDNTT